MPIDPVIIASSSLRMSPKRFSVTTRSKLFGARINQITSGPIPSPAKTAIFNVVDIENVESSSLARPRVVSPDREFRSQNEFTNFNLLFATLVVLDAACHVDGMWSEQSH